MNGRRRAVNRYTAEDQALDKIARDKHCCFYLTFCKINLHICINCCCCYDSDRGDLRLIDDDNTNEMRNISK
ncbi:hypothetical protein D917_08177 [Trichinella nativa]|uniref:Uncharacterized protein n=1 Tax=Trichinella nativa TaxID=6335 RepID=A0A1Y3ES03_9BILA|nr:hypothetical protein D917_08177 [Trichinella nativa]